MKKLSYRAINLILLCNLKKKRFFSSILSSFLLLLGFLIAFILNSDSFYFQSAKAQEDYNYQFPSDGPALWNSSKDFSKESSKESFNESSIAADSLESSNEQHVSAIPPNAAASSISGPPGAPAAPEAPAAPGTTPPAPRIERRSNGSQKEAFATEETTTESSKKPHLSGKKSDKNGNEDFEDPELSGEGAILSNAQKSKFSKASIEDITNENFPEMIESFDFQNADIQDVVKAISELTGRNFILDPGVRGKITIMAPSKITVAEAYKAFLSALSLNKWALVPSGAFYKIRPVRQAQRDGIETYSGNYYPNSDQLITRLIQLKHISAEMIQKDLRSMLTSNDGELFTYTSTNSLIISDWGSNVERIMKIIKQLDVPDFEDQLEVVPIKFAKAKDLADLINKIMNKGDSSKSGYPRGGYPGGGFSNSARSSLSGSGGAVSGSQGNAYYTVIPDDRSNSLILVGSSSGIEKIKKLLAKLDFPIQASESGGIHVYYVKNGEAEKIAQTLSGVAKDTMSNKNSPGGGSLPNSYINPAAFAGGASSQDIFGGDVKITADKNTNSLVIVASKQDYEVVLNILNKLDIPRDQVFVEAIIMEMKLMDNFNWEIGNLKFDQGGYGKSGFNGMKAETLSSLLSPLPGGGAILGFASSDSVQVKNPLKPSEVLNMPNLISFVNFLKSNTNANILSTPQLMAMDSQEASIKVGDKVATKLTTTANAGGTTTQNIETEEAVIEMIIKPFISPTSNTVRMEIKSSVKQPTKVEAPKALQDLSMPLATREIKTNIVVPNGDTAVLGGLMKDDLTEDISKVPLLGDIPILGWLFSSRSVKKIKTNMIVFLTPKIIRNAEDNQALLNNKIEKRQDFIKSVGGKDPFGAHIDEISKKKK